MLKFTACPTCNRYEVLEAHYDGREHWYECIACGSVTDNAELARIDNSEADLCRPGARGDLLDKRCDMAAEWANKWRSQD